MKKFLNVVAHMIFALLIAINSFSTAKADDDLSIPSWVVNAELSETGDLKIVEDITFEFNDEFNGVFRDIILEKTSGIEDINVFLINSNNITKYNMVNDAKKGEDGVFVVNDEVNKKIIKIFSPSEDETKTFRVSYLVKNVAVRYRDIGELYYKFLGDENSTIIDSFTVNIKLPFADKENNVRIFAHGPLNGQIHKENDYTYVLHVTDVPKKTYIEGRILFPTEFIPQSNNIVDKNNLTNILEEEASFQEKIAKDLEKRESLKNILKKVSILTSIFSLALFILFLIMFRRDKNHTTIEVNASIPEDCTPAVAAYLNSTIISSNAIIATILDLFRKGYIRVKNKENPDNNTQDQDFIILKEREIDDNLLSHEKHFIDWLINKIGNGKSVSMKEIENFSSKNRTEFSKLYNDWHKKIKENVYEKGYFDKSKTKYGVLLLILFPIIFTIGVLTLVYGSLFGIANIIISIVLLAYSTTLFFRFSDLGYIQNKKWKEFKKYMKNINKYSSTYDFTKYPLDIALIYAIALGIDKNTLSNFKIKTKNFAGDYQANSWIYWYFLLYSGKNNAFDNSINNSFGKIVGSSTSSFTGGGGAGAGGGGAGGF